MSSSTKKVPTNREALEVSRAASAVDEETSRLAFWLAPLVIFLCTTFVFLPTLWNGFVDADDQATLVGNPNYRGLGWAQVSWMFTTFQGDYYQPLSWMTFGLDYFLWEMDPFGYHLTSLLIHAFNAIVFYWIALRLLAKARPYPNGFTEFALPSAAGCAALLFALHPLRVEPVAWISARNDLLSSFFLLLTGHFYLRAASIAATGASRWQWLTLAVIAYGLSLLSKPAGLALPVILIALDIYPLGRLSGDPGKWFEQDARGLLWEKVPFFVLALAAWTIALLAKQAVPALVTSQNHGLLAGLAQFLYGVTFHLWKTVAPLGLSPIYEVQQPFQLWHWPALLSGAVVFAITLGLFLVRASWPPGLAVWLCYLVMVAAAPFGVVQSTSHIIADRNCYLSSLSWAILAGAFLLYSCQAWGKVQFRSPGFLIAASVTSPVLIILGVLSWKQVAVWHDSETLWRYTVAVAPESSQARRRLALVLIAQDKSDEAMEVYFQAVRNNPGSAPAHADLGRALAARAKLEDAMQHYRQALQIDPTFTEALSGLGNILVKRGDIDGAIQHYRRALEIDPAYPDVHVNLGNLLAARGDLGEAMVHYRRALQIDSSNVNAYFNLANALAMRGELEDAIQSYRSALKVTSTHSEAHFNLANALARQRNLEEAMKHYQEAVTLNPDFAEAYHNLGRILAAQGQLDTAIDYFRHALGINAEYAEAHASLGQALAEHGKRDEAIRHYREADRLFKLRQRVSTSP